MRLPLCDRCGKLIPSGERFFEITSEGNHPTGATTFQQEMYDRACMRKVFDLSLLIFDRVMIQAYMNVTYTLPTLGDTDGH